MYDILLPFAILLAFMVVALALFDVERFKISLL